MKLQNAHHHHPHSTSQSTPASAPPPASINPIPSSTSNAIHQSLPSLSSTSETSLDSPALIPLVAASMESSLTDEPTSHSIPIESARRSSKVESDVFKIVEQTRRNSRSDHKNFGRYFTADGTGTHGTDPSSASSSSSTNPSSMKSIPSAVIIKRMSWNNEPIKKTNSSAMNNNDLSNTNSFRSVHSSSGVSSTGSFLFSADEESSITTTTSSSIPAILPSPSHRKTADLVDEFDEFDGKSSSSTVIGTDDREHLLSSQDPNAPLLINSNMMDHTNSQHLVNRLSTSSTSTVTSNNAASLGKSSRMRTGQEIVSSLSQMLHHVRMRTDHRPSQRYDEHRTPV